MRAVTKITNNSSGRYIWPPEVWQKYCPARESYALAALWNDPLRYIWGLHADIERDIRTLIRQPLGGTLHCDNVLMMILHTTTHHIWPLIALLPAPALSAQYRPNAAGKKPPQSRSRECKLGSERIACKEAGRACSTAMRKEQAWQLNQQRRALEDRAAFAP